MSTDQRTPLPSATIQPQTPLPLLTNENIERADSAVLEQWCRERNIQLGSNRRAEIQQRLRDWISTHASTLQASSPQPATQPATTGLSSDQKDLPQQRSDGKVAATGPAPSPPQDVASALTLALQQSTQATAQLAEQILQMDASNKQRFEAVERPLDQQLSGPREAIAALDAIAAAAPTRQEVKQPGILATSGIRGLLASEFGESRTSGRQQQPRQPRRASLSTSSGAAHGSPLVSLTRLVPTQQPQPQQPAPELKQPNVQSNVPGLPDRPPSLTPAQPQPTSGAANGAAAQQPQPIGGVAGLGLAPQDDDPLVGAIQPGINPGGVTPDQIRSTFAKVARVGGFHQFFMLRMEASFTHGFIRRQVEAFCIMLDFLVYSDGMGQESRGVAFALDRIRALRGFDRTGNPTYFEVLDPLDTDLFDRELDWQTDLLVAQRSRVTNQLQQSLQANGTGGGSGHQRPRGHRGKGRKRDNDSNGGSGGSSNGDGGKPGRGGGRGGRGGANGAR